jgi:hypothetical protein
MSKTMPPEPPREETTPSPERPAAGPHAKPELTNPEATPGAGLLPDPDEPEDSMDSTSS